MFSVLIPTWNNLPFLKVCVSSIEKNSTYRHQILVFVNDGSDGTLEWVKEKGLGYIHSPQNVGVCWALNALRTLVETDYIFYINDDMYVCPDWDRCLWEEIQSLPDEKFFISSTMIQPRNYYVGSCASPADFGTSLENFDEERLLREYDKLPYHDWMGATWPPNVVHKSMWDKVGGYSIEYFPGMYSDPDFSAKLWLAGVRYFKGVAASRVYHFEQVSTSRVKKNDGSAQFLQKYGITSSVFCKSFLHRGEPFSMEKVGKISDDIRPQQFRSRLKSLLYAGRNYMIQKLWMR